MLFVLNFDFKGEDEKEKKNEKIVPKIMSFMPPACIFLFQLACRIMLVWLLGASGVVDAQTILTPTLSGTGQISFDVNGITNCQYVVQASTDLVDWASIGTNISPFTFMDSDAGRFSQRFYRTYLACDQSANPTGNVTNGLVAWYPLAGDANDYSTNGYNGSFNDSLILTNGVNGVSSSATYFENNYMSVPDVLVPNNTSFSISLWLNASQLAGNYQAIVDGGNLNIGNEGWCLAFNQANQVYIGCGSGGATSSFVFSPGIFYHVVVTAQEGSPYVFKIYINGVESGYSSLTDVTTWNEDSSVTQVGRSINGSPLYFNGAMEDVRIYNRVLSPDEIATLYTNKSGNEVETPDSVGTPDLLYLKCLDDITATPEYSYDYWPAPLKDSSILNNTNVLYYSNQESPDPGAWVSGPNGVVNSALHFHGVGGSYADTGDSNDFAFTANSYTIALWVRPLTGGGTFLSCGVAGTNGWCVNEDVNYNLFFNTYTNGVTTSVGSIPVHNDAYHAILISVSNGTNVCMYRDGVAFATGAVNVPAPSGTNTLMLGRQNLGGSFGNTLDGNIWMPQIWSRSLDDMDAVYLYLNQSGGTPWP